MTQQTRWPVGAVADVTVQGVTRRGLRADRDEWDVQPPLPDGATYAVGRDVEAVEPLVALHLTRDDADVLEGIPTGTTQRTLLERIAAAVREQVPEPEPQKRWWVEPLYSAFFTRDREARHESFVFGNLAEAQRLVDLLNGEASR